MKKLAIRFGKPGVILVLGILLLVNLALFSLPALAGSQPRILAAAPDLSIPDMKGFYSPAYIAAFLAAIGPQGRHAYQMMHFTTDLAFPFIYGLFLFAVLCRQVNLGKSPHPALPLIALLPLAADLAENFSMVAITANFPAALSGLVWLAQAFTILKFGGIGLCVVVIAVLLVRKRPGEH